MSGAAIGKLTSARELRPRLPSGALISLEEAVLCAECQHISDARGESCPRCQSRSLLSLARVLDRETWQKSDVVFDFGDPRIDEAALREEANGDHA